MLSCRYCSKSYKSNTAYEKHTLICNYRYLDSSNSPENEELKEISNLELQKIVYALANKVNEQEQQIKKLSSVLNVKRKKINVLEWLNENKECEKSFNRFINKIILNGTHLELIFTQGYISGIISIIKEFISETINVPICAFDQKDNTLFIYNKKWMIITDELFKKLIDTVTKQIPKLFTIWLEGNYNKSNTNEQQDIELLTNTQKALGYNIPQTNLYNKTYREMYKLLKINLKNIIEYEFDF